MIRLHDELTDSFAPQLAAWREHSRNGAIFRIMTHMMPSEDEVIERHGPTPFYLSDTCLTGTILPTACHYLISRDSAGPQPANPAAARWLRGRLISSPTPWLPADPWWEQYDGATELPWWVRDSLNATWPPNGEDLATFLVLFLPYLETFCAEGESLLGPIGVAAEILRQRSSSRSGTRLTTAGDFARSLGNDSDVPMDCAWFLARWAVGEISVVAARILRGPETAG